MGEEEGYRLDVSARTAALVGLVLCCAVGGF